MDEYLEKLRSNKSDWHIQLQETIYPASIDAYWSRLGDARAALQKANDTPQHSVRATEGPEDTAKIDEHISILNETSTELRRVVDEEAYKPKKILEAVEQVKSAMHAADEYKLRQPDDAKAAKETAGD